MLRATIMRATTAALLCASAVALYLAWPARQTPPALSTLALSFEPNLGQAPASVAFLARAPAGPIVFDARGATFAESGLTLTLEGGRPCTWAGEQPLPGRINALVGPRERWRTSIPTFARVRCPGAYPGIDVVFYGDGQQLEYDFEVAPGADPRLIRIAFQHAGPLTLSSSGDLELDVHGRRVTQPRPRAHVDVDGERQPVDVRYALDGAVASLEVAPFDRRHRLTIDPVVRYATFLGGNLQTLVNSIAAFPDGGVVIAGSTLAADFPIAAALDPSLGGIRDGFVTRLNASGTSLVFSTYLGGTGPDSINAVAVLPGGDLFLAGSTNSADFPLVGAYQAVLNGTEDAFVARLDADGTALSFSTLLGGDLIDRAVALSFDDPAERVFVAGTTNSGDFPGLSGTFATNGSFDTFVATLTTDGGMLATALFGGRDSDLPFAMQCDPDSASLYVVGRTDSDTFYVGPATSLPGRRDGGLDGFVLRLDYDVGYLNGTYLGGMNDDEATCLTVNPFTAELWVGGSTRSPNFPTLDPQFPTLNGMQNGFITRLTLRFLEVQRSTFLGGSTFDAVRALATDPQGRVFVGGSSSSSDFPTLHSLLPHRSDDGFLGFVDLDGGFAFLTLLGGTGVDTLTGLAVTGPAETWAIGATNSNDFPTVQPLFAQRPLSSGWVAHLDLNGPHLAAVAPDAGPTAGGSTVEVRGWNLAPDLVLSFGDAGASYTWQGPDRLTAVLPPHASGTVDVRVSPPDGGEGDVLAAAFRYVQAPVVHAVTPTSGPIAGGTPVILTGDDFVAGMTVVFGDAGVQNLVMTSATSCFATTPPHAAGPIDVTVTGSFGIPVTTAALFTYDPPPTVRRVLPVSGPAAGGAHLRLDGDDFVSGATVKLDGLAATSVVFVSASALEAVAPPHAEGNATVVVTNPDGQSGTAPLPFEYLGPPTLEGVEPTSGSSAGDERVSLTGTNFAAGMTVSFGGAAATDVSITSATSLTARTPAHAAGAVDVTVTQLDGPSATRTEAFTYVAPPVEAPQQRSHFAFCGVTDVAPLAWLVLAWLARQRRSYRVTTG